ncbi:hypothetical protein Hypma_002714 [Hypsizygus marmoreus]|uniref:Uncharacterized protein n=1 Tax=Hypsizygus marmoreus TaxID=39966 RepID=A0A369J5F1_HYPMA|nr:hypothetical protein Hypma_002714 [Hypsizygus marmoreus]
MHAPSISNSVRQGRIRMRPCTYHLYTLKTRMRTWERGEAMNAVSSNPASSTSPPLRNISIHGFLHLAGYVNRGGKISPRIAPQLEIRKKDNDKGTWKQVFTLYFPQDESPDEDDDQDCIYAFEAFIYVTHDDLILNITLDPRTPLTNPHTPSIFFPSPQDIRTFRLPSLNRKSHDGALHLMLDTTPPPPQSIASESFSTRRAHHDLDLHGGIL